MAISTRYALVQEPWAKASTEVEPASATPIRSLERATPLDWPDRPASPPAVSLSNSISLGRWLVGTPAVYSPRMEITWNYLTTHFAVHLFT